jgi:hypothetical protein
MGQCSLPTATHNTRSRAGQARTYKIRAYTTETKTGYKLRFIDIEKWLHGFKINSNSLNHTDQEKLLKMVKRATPLQKRMIFFHKRFLIFGTSYKEHQIFYNMLHQQEENFGRHIFFVL